MERAEQSDEEVDRLERERQFHDDRFGSDEGRSSSRFYVVNNECEQLYHDRVTALSGTGRVLEIGCGPDSAALELARSGAEVLGIDISPVAIETAQRAAGDQPGVRFAAMDAEQLDLDDGSIDLVIGTGILHHLDLARISPEIRRVLAPGGHAVFIEPLGHNPLINLYRRVTPGERTVDEHPLLTSDFAFFRREWGSVTLTSFVLLALLALPFRRFGFFDRLVTTLQRGDRFLFHRVPRLQPLAWTVVIELADPTPSASRTGTVG